MGKKKERAGERERERPRERESARERGRDREREIDREREREGEGERGRGDEATLTGVSEQAGLPGRRLSLSDGLERDEPADGARLWSVRLRLCVCGSV